MEEQKIQIPERILKENAKNVCKSTKKERRKKVMKFADIATKRLGPVKVSGIGEGKPNKCDICGEVVHKTVSLYDEKVGKWIAYCSICLK